LANARICKDKEKKSKRISSYLESENWKKYELLSIINYETCFPKATLTLLWDLKTDLMQCQNIAGQEKQVLLG